MSEFAPPLEMDEIVRQASRMHCEVVVASPNELQFDLDSKDSRRGFHKVQAHHDDYSKPLEVRWLCVPHHALHHKQLRQAAKNQ